MSFGVACKGWPAQCLFPRPGNVCDVWAGDPGGIFPMPFGRERRPPLDAPSVTSGVQEPIWLRGPGFPVPAGPPGVLCVLGLVYVHFAFLKAITAYVYLHIRTRGR